MSELCVIGVYWQVETVMFSLEPSRDSKFEAIWQQALDGINNLNIRDPELPRQSKISKSLKSNNEFGKNHLFQSPKDMYQKIYFEIFDQILISMKSRFETNLSQFFKSLEAFAIGNTSDIDKIIGFYDDNFDRDIFLNLTSRSNNAVRNSKEAVEFSRENEYTMVILPEYVKFIRSILQFQVLHIQMKRLSLLCND